MVDPVHVHDQMIRVETPQRRAREVEGSGPGPASHHPRVTEQIRGGDRLGA